MTGLPPAESLALPEHAVRHHPTAPDMPHKNELPAALFARAALIATDDHRQCLDHGDFGHAVRAGSTAESGDTPFGLLLEGPVDRPDGAITVADLTGVGAVDAALASAVLRELAPPAR
ncbi:hypothetical protein ACFRMQ_30290 [Kitasatospora sp. NPDC056783]|uniref:hypothetical protein n=1 Tax=Kitasatospora sp. NPDC056783 TaxID=3345943 RepID=UPI00368A2C43